MEVEVRRMEAIKGFLGAGLHTASSWALAVETLAHARRAVARCLARGQAVDEWLADEVRLRGIKEDAAVLDVLELPEYRVKVAESSRREHPDRMVPLNVRLAVIE